MGLSISIKSLEAIRATQVVLHCHVPPHQPYIAVAHNEGVLETHHWLLILRSEAN